MQQPSLNFVQCTDSTDGHLMAYWQWGNPHSAHVVVCAHGLSRQGRDFDVLAQALVHAAPSGNIRVVCVDVVGRGESGWLKDPSGYQVPQYAADMLALLAQLRAQAPITELDWLGTSMGGLIGMVVCGQLGSGVAQPSQEGQAAAVPSLGGKSMPGPIRRLVLNDVGPALQWQAIVRIGAYLGTAGLFDSVQAAAGAMWAISTGFGPHTPEQWLALSRPMTRPISSAPNTQYRLHYDPALAVPFKQATEASTLQSEQTLWQLYDHITADTLLLRGAESDLLSPATAKAMTERGPKATLVEFAGVGHAPTFIAPDQVAAVVSFLLR